jgi:hypothetical protein
MAKSEPVEVSQVYIEPITPQQSEVENVLLDIEDNCYHLLTQSPTTMEQENIIRGLLNNVVRLRALNTK